MRGRIFAPGAIANDAGDIYGQQPHQIIRIGRVSIEEECAAIALNFGWRDVGAGQADPGFARLERTEEERAQWL